MWLSFFSLHFSLLLTIGVAHRSLRKSSIFFNFKYASFSLVSWHNVLSFSRFNKHRLHLYRSPSPNLSFSFSYLLVHDRVFLFWLCIFIHPSRSVARVTSFSYSLTLLRGSPFSSTFLEHVCLVSNRYLRTFLLFCPLRSTDFPLIWLVESHILGTSFVDYVET